jgi:hypothetical protein
MRYHLRLHATLVLETWAAGTGQLPAMDETHGESLQAADRRRSIEFGGRDSPAMSFHAFVGGETRYSSSG